MPFYHNYDLEEQKRSDEFVKESASLKAARLIKNWEGLISDMEKLLMTYNEDRYRSVFLSAAWWSWPKKKVCNVEKRKARPNYDGEFIASLGGLKDSRIIIYDIIWKWMVRLWVLM